MIAIVVKIYGKTTAKPLPIFLREGLYVLPSGKCLFDIKILHTEFVLYQYKVSNKSRKRLYQYNLFASFMELLYDSFKKILKFSSKNLVYKINRFIFASEMERQRANRSFFSNKWFIL